MSKFRDAGRIRTKATRTERELQLLLQAEYCLREIMRTHGRPTQNYDFLRQPLTQLEAERETLQLAKAGDPIAQRMRRSRRPL